MPTEATTAQNLPKTKVFISYSRKDADFCERLAEALHQHDYEAVYDQSPRPNDDPETRLSAQDEWWKQLQVMIAACDAMVFVVTPESAASAVCDQEIAHARSLGKRVIAILRRAIDFDAAPERLRALNIKLDFSEDSEKDFAVKLDLLRAELDLDIDWHRQGARLVRQAHQWESDGRPDGQLLRAGAIADAETWLSRRPLRAPEPGPVLLALLEESRTKERVDYERLRKTTARAFVRPIEQAAEAGKLDAALRLAGACAALADDPDFTSVAEVTSTVLSAAYSQKLRAATFPGRQPIRVFSYSVASGLAAVGSPFDPFVHVFNAADLAEVTRVPLPRGPAGRKAGGRATIMVPLDSRVEGWTSQLQVAAFNERGSLAVTANDSELRIWDAREGSERNRLTGHEGQICAVCFVSDDGVLCSADRDGCVRLWNVNDGRNLRSWKFEPGEADKLKSSPDGHMIAMIGATCVRVWDLEQERFLVEIKHPSSEPSASVYFEDAAFCAGQSGGIITTSWDGTARVWDLRTGNERRRLVGHTDWVISANCSQDGTKIVTASADQTARIWDTAEGAALVVLEGHQGEIQGAIFDASASRVLTWSKDKTARVWDAITGSVLLCMSGHETELVGAAFVGQSILTASDALRLWDAGSDEQVASLQGHDGAVNCAIFSGDGKTIATGSRDGTARVWDADSGELKRCFRAQDNVTQVAINEAGNLLIAVLENGTAELFDVKVGKVHQIGIRECIQAKFSPCADMILIVYRNGDVCALDRNTGAEAWRIGAIDGGYCRVAMSPDKQQLATASRGGFGNVFLQLWKRDSAQSGGWQKAAKLEGHRGAIFSLAFSRDGRFLVSGADDATARIWNPESATQLACVGSKENKLGVYSADVTESVDRIVTATGQGAHVFDVHSGERIALFTARSGRTLSAALNPNANRIVTAHDGPDHTAIVWDVGRTKGLTGPAKFWLPAVLDNGRGCRTSREADDVLMQSAPEDGYKALTEQLTQVECAEVRRRAAILSGPLHANCYLPPSQRPGWHGAAVRGTENGSSPTTRPRLAEAISAMESEAAAPATVRKGSHLTVAAFLAVTALIIAAGTFFLATKLGWLRIN